MVRWLGILFGTLRSSVRTHRELALENLALRQQLAVWKARQPRPRLTEMDRIFRVLLARLWTSWRDSVHVVRPETVVGWHRHGFRCYWAWKSRHRPSLWRAIFASGQDIGHPGDGHRAPLAVARRVCRAGDWLEVRQLLQRDADTFIAV